MHFRLDGETTLGSGGSRNLERGFPVARAEATPTNYNRTILMLQGIRLSICMRARAWLIVRRHGAYSARVRATYIAGNELLMSKQKEVSMETKERVWIRHCWDLAEESMVCIKYCMLLNFAVL